MLSFFLKLKTYFETSNTVYQFEFATYNVYGRSPSEVTIIVNNCDVIVFNIILIVNQRTKGP